MLRPMKTFLKLAHMFTTDVQTPINRVPNILFSSNMSFTIK